MGRFKNGKTPFVRIADSKGHNTSTMMRDFLIALIPVILFGWYKNGLKPFINDEINFYQMLYPLIIVIVGGLACYILEGFALFLMDKDAKTFKGIVSKLKVTYPAIPGILLALILPSYTPIWVLVTGCFFATIIAKMLFGGFGHNVFNPALVGYILIAFAFTGVISNAGESLSKITAITGATPLAVLAGNQTTLSYDVLVKPFGSLLNFFLGTIPGAFGETSALACLVAFIYLVVRRVINYKLPVIYIATVFILSWIIGLTNGVTGIWFPVYSILSGGVFFGAVFMLTEPVTSPRNPLGKVWYGVFVGILTVLFRFVGVLPEGVATAILAGNIFVIMIDTASAKVRAIGYKKSALRPVIIFGCLLVLLSTFTVVRASSIYQVYTAPNITSEIKEVKQNLDKYEEINVTVDVTKDGVLKTYNLVYNLQGAYVSGVQPTDINVTELDSKVKSKIDSLSNVIFKVEKKDDTMLVTVKSIGYNPGLKIEYTIKNSTVISAKYIAGFESYENSESYSGALPPAVENKFTGELENFTGVTGATMTSNALKSSLVFVKAFIPHLSSYTTSLNSIRPNFDNLDEFIANVTYAVNNTDVTTDIVLDKDGNFLRVVGTASNPLEEAQTKFKNEAVEAVKKFAKVVSVEKNNTTYTLVVQSSGYVGQVKTTFTITDGVITNVTTTDFESYAEEYNDQYQGADHPAVEEKFASELDNFTGVAGATYTSQALKKNLAMAKIFIESVKGGN